METKEEKDYNLAAPALIKDDYGRVDITMRLFYSRDHAEGELGLDFLDWPVKFDENGMIKVPNQTTTEDENE